MKRFFAPVAGLVTFFALWEGLLLAFDVQEFILPRPSRIWRAIAGDPGFFVKQAGVTGREALVGLLIALVGAIAFAIPMARWRSFDRAVQPVATLIQVIPLVCYAPAFVIWLKPGFKPIIAVTALVAFVPLLFNLVAGLRAADPAAREMLESAGASQAEVLRHLLLPCAVPQLFAGLRVAVGLSLIGAVLGEWFALVSDGLGVQIQKGGAIMGGSVLIWSSAFVLGALGGLALVTLTALERLVPAARHRSDLH